jgi:ABC-type enterochelin transport system, periplasmic component
MNKKVLGIVLAVIVVLGGGYFAFQGINNGVIAPQGDLEVTHELGTVLVPRNPQNIAVFDYGTLDSLDALGVEVAGVAQSSIPAHLAKFSASSYTDLGTLHEPNFETLAALQPDIILISGRQRSHYEALSEIAPTIYFGIDNDDYIGSFNNNVRTLGEIFNKTTEVEAIIADIESSVNQINVAAKATSAKALILLTNSGEISAYGPSSRFGIIHNTLGIEPVDANIETATHGQSVSFEYVVEKNPDYIFVVDRSAVVGAGNDTKIFENDLMKNVTAYQENQIIFLDQGAWYIASGGIESTQLMMAEIEAVFN